MFAKLPYAEVSVADVAGHLDQFDRVIDVRETPELHGPLSHIPNVTHVPMQSVPAAAEAWGKDEKLLFVCRSGARSGQVCRWLAQHGYDHTHNLVGGMIAWNEAQQPTVG